MKIGLIGNGDVGDFSYLLDQLKECGQVIAVDGGIRHLVKLNFSPDIILGDFDSATEEELARFPEVKRIKFSREKDLSDMALAVRQALKSDPDKIVLYAALGSRMDHTLANLSLLTEYPQKVFIETERETLYAVKTCSQKSYPGQIISFFALGDKASGVTTRGLKWELEDAEIDNKLYSLSNVVLRESFEITVRSGTLLIVIHHDKA